MCFNLINVILISLNYILLRKEYFLELIKNDSVIVFVTEYILRFEELVHLFFCKFDSLLHNQTVHEILFFDHAFSCEVDCCECKLCIGIHFCKFLLEFIPDSSYLGIFVKTFKRHIDFKNNDIYYRNSNLILSFEIG